jgi:hypothetical protein
VIRIPNEEASRYLIQNIHEVEYHDAFCFPLENLFVNAEIIFVNLRTVKELILDFEDNSPDPIEDIKCQIAHHINAQ